MERSTMFFHGFSWLKMVMFDSYLSLPEGTIRQYLLTNVYRLRTGKWPSRNSGFIREAWWIFPCFVVGYVVFNMFRNPEKNIKKICANSGQIPISW